MKLADITQQKPYACVVGTAYSLFLYLLYHPLSVIKRTSFLVGDYVRKDLTESLSAECLCVRVGDRMVSSRPILCRILGFFHLCLMYERFVLLFFHMRYIRNHCVYAQDYLHISAGLLCQTPYVLLEDAPGFYKECHVSPYWRPKRYSFIKSVLYTLIRGPLFGRGVGGTKYCLNRIVSEASDLSCPTLMGRRCELVSLKRLWEVAPEEKKEFILKVFGVHDEIFEDVGCVETVILTQPFNIDCWMSEDEVVDLYRPYVERYRKGGVLIKCHPRDTIDYKRWFPLVKVLRSRAPVQLLSMLAPAPKRVVTVCSTAVSAYPSETEVVWIGTKIDKRILSYAGEVKPPTSFTHIVFQ